MQSHYEINVSLRGKHMFATAERSCVTAAKAAVLLGVLQERFPVSEGFEVSCTFWDCQGRTVTNNLDLINS